MKILNLMVEGSTPLSDQIIDIISKDNEVKTIELTNDYDSIIDEIFAHDKVIAW